MEVLSERQILVGLHVLSAVTDVSVDDLKGEFEEIVRAIGGKNSKPVDANDEKLNLEIKSIALERLFKTHQKPLQWIIFVNKAKEAEDTKRETV